MTNLLRRSQAPLTDKAWEEVDDQAKQILKAQLSARRIVDVDGPHGWDLAAVDTGRLQLLDPSAPEDVPWGIRAVLPLVELRMPFVLRQMELDAISRGCKDPDLEPLEKAVNQAAQFEESAIYRGLPGTQMRGILQAAEHGSVPLPDDPLEYPTAVARALESLEAQGVPGPYLVVLGRTPFYRLMQKGQCGYPPHRLIDEMTHHKTYSSPALPGGLVLSAATGNFELTIGQDWSIGYASHDRDQVELYVTESFVFRVLEPAAAVELKAAS